MGAAPWQAVAGGVLVRVRLTPRGGRDALEGVEALSDGRCVVAARVRSAPENGAANEALRRLVARTLELPVSAVMLQAGHTARLKTLRVEGAPEAVAARLERATRE